VLIRIHQVGDPRIIGARQVDGPKSPSASAGPEGYLS
jgi:hypothetical protein